MKQSSDKISNLPIAIIAVASHLYGFIIFGAVFWIDSKAYISLGYALGLENGLREFYTGVGIWFYSHIQPGVALIWLALENLPKSMHWPVLAVFQHAVGAGALFYFFSTINDYWPSRWNYVGCLVIAFLPFYQAAHNSLMTESLSSSLILMGLSLAMRIRRDISPDYRKLLLLAFILLLLAQFRSYFGLLLFGASLIALYRFLISNFRLSCILVLTLAISLLVFPAYRYLKTGLFWLPTLGMNKLKTGWGVNPLPTEEALKKLESFDFPDKLAPLARVNKGLSYSETADVALHWRATGLTDFEINRRALAAGTILANDTLWVSINRGFLALTSSGMLLPYCALSDEMIVSPGYSAKEMCAHMRWAYDFHSWLSVVDHRPIFEKFFGHEKATESFALPFDYISSQSMYEDTETYLAERKIWQRDPLGLGRINPDWFIISALLAMVLTSRDRKFFASMCAWVMIGNASVNFLAAVGNPRYGYFLFPLYSAFAFLGVAQFDCWLRSRRLVPTLSHRLWR